MKLRVLSALLLFNFATVALTWAQQNVPAPAKAFATAPEIAYDSVPNFLKLPTGMYLGEGIGVARNSKGHVFVYTRGGDTSHLYEFDPNGVVRARDWQGPLWFPDGPRRARRSSGQHLGRR